MKYQPGDIVRCQDLADDAYPGNLVYLLILFREENSKSYKVYDMNRGDFSNYTLIERDWIYEVL